MCLYWQIHSYVRKDLSKTLASQNSLSMYWLLAPMVLPCILFPLPAMAFLISPTCKISFVSRIHLNCSLVKHPFFTIQPITPHSWLWDHCLHFSQCTGTVSDLSRLFYILVSWRQLQCLNFIHPRFFSFLFLVLLWDVQGYSFHFQVRFKLFFSQKILSIISAITTYICLN